VPTVGVVLGENDWEVSLETIDVFPTKVQPRITTFASRVSSKFISRRVQFLNAVPPFLIVNDSIPFQDDERVIN
jgi:hypothetical protein